MKLSCLAMLFGPLASALAMLSQRAPHQKPLLGEHVRQHYEKVNGDNPAYFMREKQRNQLFAVTEFSVSPYPPVPNHRIFFFLSGMTRPGEDYSGLVDATLEIVVKQADKDDDDKTSFKNKLSDFGLFTVRDSEHNYGGPLVLGPNEMVGDFFMLKFGHDHGTAKLDIEVVAKLPDDRLLFAFGGRVEYEF